MNDTELENASSENSGKLESFDDGAFDWDPGEQQELVGERIQVLEQEQESLLFSLMALTTHFAQVQFRLHQISAAPEDKRDVLLKELEDFADRGIPNCAELNILNKMDQQRNHQQELIEQLKNQLEDLEKYAYESGEPVLPQSIVLEKQKIIIDELKQKINLNFNELELPQLSPDELRNQVDQAIGEFVSPLKMKEQLVAQLKTQVNDLERFIKFLQGERREKKMMLRKQKGGKGTVEEDHDKACNCKEGRREMTVCDGNPKTALRLNNHLQSSGSEQNSRNPSAQNNGNDVPGGLGGRFFNLFGKASTLLQIFALSQLGECANSQQQQFKKNTLKKTSRGNHWGDIRAGLEVDIQEVLALGKQIQRSKDRQINLELVTLVRKKFAVTLQHLIQHGLRRVNEQRHLVPFIAYFASYPQQKFNRDDASSDYEEMHAWELLLEYYNMKNGDFYNETPAQKLSQSYNLNINGDCMSNNKQSLLYTIRNIINIHSPYKRSLNSHFKAFVCAGLNSHKLVQWLNLIFQNKELTTKFYTSWSYVANTGFRDALKSLDQLTQLEFDLPVDLAIRQFQNIKDVFL